MGSVEKTIAYLEGPREENTETVLRMVKKRAEELGIRDIVVASTLGNTGVRASEVLKGFNVVVVTHCTGLWDTRCTTTHRGESEDQYEANGAKIYTGTDFFMSIQRAIKNTYDVSNPAEIMAETLRLFGEGMKVAVEVVAMATDAGKIPADKEVISVAGTGSGADTAIVVKPANSHRLFDMNVREIIVKPRKKQ